eukprot:5710708-Prymnesium_polylepis.1
MCSSAEVCDQFHSDTDFDHSRVKLVSCSTKHAKNCIFNKSLRSCGLVVTGRLAGAGEAAGARGACRS